MLRNFLLLYISIIFSVLAYGQEKRPFNCPEPRWSFGTTGTDVRIGNINKKGLKKINSVYYKNDTAVFYNYVCDIGSSRAVIVETMHKIEGAEPNSFEIIQEPYTRDKSKVYFHGFFINEAEPQSFCPLTSFYSKDENAVFLKNCKIEDVDINSFRVVNNGGYYDFAYDDNYLYFYSERVPIDKETFSIENIDCEQCVKNVCRDKKYTYYLRGTSFDGFISKIQNAYNL